MNGERSRWAPKTTQKQKDLEYIVHKSYVLLLMVYCGFCHFGTSPCCTEKCSQTFCTITHLVFHGGKKRAKSLGWVNDKFHFLGQLSLLYCNKRVIFTDSSLGTASQTPLLFKSLGHVFFPPKKQGCIKIVKSNSKNVGADIHRHIEMLCSRHPGE